MDTGIVEINFGLAEISFIEKQRKIGELMEVIEKDHIVIHKASQNDTIPMQSRSLVQAKNQAIKN